MLTRFTDFDSLFGFPEVDRAFELLDLLRREGGAVSNGGTDAYLRADLWDNGEDMVFQADVPGMTEQDVQLTIHQDILTVTGQRQVQAPKGYQVHRRERPELRFSRSYRLPYRADVERANARVQQGVLTVTLPKAAEAKPRRISVQAQ